MTIGNLTVKLNCDTDAFKSAMADVVAAVEALEAAVAKLNATAIAIDVENVEGAET
jgi:hypothetical protein